MRKILTVIFISVLAAGCYNDKTDQLYPKVSGGGCDTTTISFKTNIQPILNASCALSGCHDAATPTNGYNFGLYSGAKLALDQGRLLGAIRHESGFSAMPKNAPKLDDCSINKIVRWANLGAQDN